MPTRTGISNFFESLGAPLKNVRWSWGAERRDGAIFLRGWEDHRFTDDSGEYVVVAHSTEMGDGASAGWRERWHHIQRIGAGAPCFVVMCIPKDVHSIPREIESFNTRELIVGGKLVVKNGWTCLEVVDRRSPMTLIDRTRIGK
jgi:hypothetical protein